MSKFLGWFTPQHRAWLYRVLAALGVVLVGYGVLSSTDLALWLGFAATLLGTGTAAANTSTKKD